MLRFLLGCQLSVVSCLCFGFLLTTKNYQLTTHSRHGATLNNNNMPGIAAAAQTK